MKKTVNLLWFTVIIMIIGRLNQLTTINALDITISDGSLDLPVIEWPVDEVVLEYGAIWNVTCKCHKPIVWKPFDVEYKWDPPNITVSNYNTTDNNMSHGAMLTITNASALMVGRYYCVHSEKQLEDLDEMLAENVASSIYVFVKDPHQLVVPDPVKYYKNREGVVVLCKPSHPEVELELCDRTYERWLPTLDPTKGFFIVGSSYNRSAEFSCNTNGTKHTAKLDTINEEGLLKPTIHSNVGDYVPIGITVRLTCTFEVYLDRNVKMLWRTLPNYQPTGIDKAIFVGNQTKITRQKRTLVKRELVIENVTLAHKRTYRCEVFDDKNNTYYHNFKLQIRETPDDFVILSTAHNRTIINRWLNENGETTPIHIIIQYKAYPSNITYEWFRDESGIIYSNETDDYKQEVTEDYVKLRIKQPKVYHTDSYTVSVQAGTASANFTVSVFVYCKPSLTMDSMKAIEGDLVTFNCLAESYPSADESFIFQPCASVPWENCSFVSETDPGWQAGTDEVEAVHWAAATFKIVANEPGIVYCKANNTEGHGMTLAYLMLEDVVKTEFMKLEIVQPKGWITVGDNVTFVCSVVTNKDTVVMRFEHNGKEHSGTVIRDDSLMQITQLTLLNVSRHDSGNLFCIVNYGINIKPTEQRFLDMEVIEAIAPQLQSGAINQTLIVDALEPITLECDVGGIPSPKITWFKDGAPFAYNMSNLTGVTSITIEYAIPSQSGLYECVAENKKGNITIIRNVTVRIPELKSSQPLLYATVILLLLTIAFAITSLQLYVKMKQATGVANVQDGHIQIVPHVIHSNDDLYN